MFYVALSSAHSLTELNSTQFPSVVAHAALSRSLALSLTLGHCDCVRYGWGRDIVGAINLRDRNEYFIAYFRFTH